MHANSITVYKIINSTGAIQLYKTLGSLRKQNYKTPQ